MTSRERILTTCAHRQPDKLPVDFGGGFQTGIHVSMSISSGSARVGPPGTPVRVVEVTDARRGCADLQRRSGSMWSACTAPAPCSASRRRSSRHGSLPTAPVLLPRTSTPATSQCDLLQWPARPVRAPSAACRAGILRCHHPPAAVGRGETEPRRQHGGVPARPRDGLDHYCRLAERLATTTTGAVLHFGGLTFATWCPRRSQAAQRHPGH